MVEPKVKSQLEVTLHSTLDLLGSIWLSLGFTTLLHSTMAQQLTLNFTLLWLYLTLRLTVHWLYFTGVVLYQAIFNSTLALYLVLLSIIALLYLTLLYHGSTWLYFTPWVHLTLLGSTPFTTMALHGFTMAVLESSSLSLLWSYFTLLHSTSLYFTSLWL